MVLIRTPDAHIVIGYNKEGWSGMFLNIYHF
ncbi:uncharacterized protein METZ01_LOCUS42410 [marine metagenome]|uniref:Uncharacterized protein n=1 Tax=marine metagenome TaxID=408172 RepID=A0A381RCN8_9ZZZZ